MCHILAFVNTSGEFRNIVTPFQQADVKAVHIRQICSVDEMRDCLLGSNAPRDIKYCIVSLALPEALECLEYAHFALKSEHNPVEFAISGPYSEDHEEVQHFLGKAGPLGKIPYFQIGRFGTDFAPHILERYAA